MQFTTTVIALALAATGIAAPATDFEARQAQTNILLCKNLDCSGQPYEDQVNLSVLSGVCKNIPATLDGRTIDFIKQVRAIQPNSGTSCFLFDQIDCNGNNSTVIIGGPRTVLNVAPYNFEKKAISLLCSV